MGVGKININFESTLLRGREGVTEKMTLCTLLIKLTILDSPLFRLMDNVHINYILCSKFLARINHEPTGLCVRVKWNIDL